MRAPFVSLIISSCLLFIACKAEAPATPPPPITELSAAALSKLAAADKADGAEDHVISKCPSCMLRMDGHADHALTLGDYTVHSCHSACAEALAADPEGVIARLP